MLKGLGGHVLRAIMVFVANLPQVSFERWRYWYSLYHEMLSNSCDELVTDEPNRIVFPSGTDAFIQTSGFPSPRLWHHLLARSSETRNEGVSSSTAAALQRIERRPGPTARWQVDRC
jgi:hypothetical protein